MKARLAPLEGKYYGSKVIVTDDNFENEQCIMVWCNEFNYDPSEREYDVEIYGKFYVIDRDSFNDTKEVQINSTLWEYEIYNNHYESVSSYKIAQAIVAAINGLEV